MTTYQTSIVAGVFQNSDQAQQAVDALRQADFKYDQVGVAMRTAPNATPNLHDDLMRLGVSHEQASFYEQEYQAGRIVVSIRPDGRDDQARDILRQYGAYDHSTNMSSRSAMQQNAAPEDRNVEGPTDSGQMDQAQQNQAQSSTWNNAEQEKRQPQTQNEEDYRQGWHPGMNNQPGPEQRPNP